MKLTDYALSLQERKAPVKKASTELSMPSLHKSAAGLDIGKDSVPFSWGNTAKAVGLMYAIPKGLSMVENAVSNYMNSKSDSQKNAIFQQMMQQHPNLQGKDPIRAKANFDYLAEEAPHLLDHPILLGDHVANMTSLGTTDPATLNMLATMTKSRNEANRTHGGDNSNQDIGSTVAKTYLTHVKTDADKEDKIKGTPWHS